MKDLVKSKKSDGGSVTPKSSEASKARFVEDYLKKRGLRLHSSRSPPKKKTSKKKSSPKKSSPKKSSPKKKKKSSPGKLTAYQRHVKAYMKKNRGSSKSPTSKMKACANAWNKLK